MKKIKNLLLSFSLIIAALFLIGCDKGETGSGEPEFVDYVGQLKLDKTVTATSNFFGNDGVGLAEVVRCVDGDTALFLTNGQEFTARFLGVDTPESTGQVEEWGKTASKFTAEKLNNAVSIVVQSNGGPAEKDSTGDRYLTFVWYKPAVDADYRLLNLELVQEGLSYGKTSTVSLYIEDFIAAQNQAMQLGLRVFGDDIDENYFYGDAVETTIRYIIENKASMINETTKVKFDCTVVKVDGLYVYAQDYDAETDTYYSILLYKGYSLTTTKLEPGNRVSICGNVMEYDGQVQVTNMKDIKFVTSLDNIQLLEKNYPIDCLNVTVDEINAKDPVLSRRFVRLENIVVTKLWTTQQGDSMGAVTITGTVNGQEVTVRTSVLYDENYNLITEDYYRNHTITVEGIIEEYQGSYQIKVCSINDVIIVE